MTAKMRSSCKKKINLLNALVAIGKVHRHIVCAPRLLHQKQALDRRFPREAVETDELVDQLF